jgi:CRISPR-associated protein (TIGR02584 family)
VLLAVAGLSPQILTETLYALAVAADPPWVPTEIRLLTTTEGAERARLSLLSADLGWFDRLLADYHLPAIPFGPEDIQIIADAEGRPLPDIRDQSDNTSVADQITETIRAITADPDCALHVSLAGGRKTMGYYAGYALSLFGRAQDRLSHVLVSEPFEQSWAFFYPTPYPRVIETRDGKLADTQTAQVTLAEVPFVRLRDGVVPERLLRGHASFGETIAAAQRALAPADLLIDLATRRIRAAGEIIELPPAPLAFYALMARRRHQGLHPARWNTDGITEQYLSEYRYIVGRDSAELDRVETALAQGMTKDDFDQRKARTNRELTQALGDQLAAPYLIHADGARPNTRYRLALEPKAIRFGDLHQKAHTNGQAD